MKFRYAVALAGVVFATSGAADPIADALAGKTLVAPGQEIKAHKNARLSCKVGKDLKTGLEGARAIRRGKWCRTPSKPEGAAVAKCQDISPGDDTVTIVGSQVPVACELR